MKAEDVPAGLVELACDAMFGTPPAPSDDWPTVRRALAAVLPEHEKQVRERVAREIEQVQAADDDGSSWGGGMLRAVEIARGGS